MYKQSFSTVLLLALLDYCCIGKTSGQCHLSNSCSQTGLRCPDGYYQQNNVCIPYQQYQPAKVTCPPNSVYNNGVCLAQQQIIYQQPSFIQQPTFVQSPTSCGANMVLYNGRCHSQSVATCPYTSTLQNGICMRNQVQTIQPQIVQPQIVEIETVKPEIVIQPQVTIQPQMITQAIPIMQPAQPIQPIVQPSQNIHKETIIKEVVTSPQNQTTDINITNIVNSTNIENIVTNINSTNINNIKLGSGSVSGTIQSDNETREIEEKYEPEETFEQIAPVFPPPEQRTIMVPQPYPVAVQQPTYQVVQPVGCQTGGCTQQISSNCMNTQYEGCNNGLG